MRHLSIRSKILLVMLVTGLLCLGAGGLIGYQAGDQALTQAVEQRLTAQREMKRQRVETYIETRLRVTSALGGARETIEATQGFIAAISEMKAAEAAVSPAAKQSDASDLETWYRKDLLPRLDRITGGQQPLEGLFPSDPVSRRLQADYIARNPNPVGEKSKLGAAPGNSPYDTAHARFHPMMQRMADAVGFYDINLIDAQTGEVVYTVAKETDFASNLYHGPYEQSGLAHLVQKALDPRNGGGAVIEDYAAYEPSAFLPQLFVGIPIVVDGQTIGVFTGQIDVATLNGLINDENQWRRTGQGETGEVLLIGEDRLLRSQSRFMIESPDKFLEQAEANGLPAATAGQIRNLGTTILSMPVRTEAIEAAFHNKTGVAYDTDYRGMPAVAAYGPLEVAGLRWAIDAKQDIAEAFGPAARLRRSLLTAAAAAAIGLTFAAVACAAAFTRPLRRVLAGMKSVDARGGLARVPVEGDDEFGELARGYNTMADTIDDRTRSLAAADQEKADLLRLIYPEAVAEKLRKGAEITAETVSNVTVAMVWIDGLDSIASALSVVEIRDRLNALLSALSTAAAAHGVEPVRSLGESYICVCGLSSPRLDHAARTLAWARAGSVAVEQLAKDWGAPISLRFGIASGEIDVLLLTHGHSAFDIWGRTLSVARYLAVGTKPGSVKIDDTTYRLLSDVEGFEPCPAIETPSWGAVASWVRPAVERDLAEAAQ
jgi:class 3 adenylate cyclase